MTRHNWSHIEAGGTIVPPIRTERRRPPVGVALAIGARLLGLACIVLYVPRAGL